MKRNEAALPELATEDGLQRGVADNALQLQVGVKSETQTLFAQRSIPLGMTFTNWATRQSASLSYAQHFPAIGIREVLQRASP
jgi:hypothetical protein